MQVLYCLSLVCIKGYQFYDLLHKFITSVHYICLYILCVLSYSESLSNSGNVTKENASVPFSVTVLTSWDHSLVSGEAAENLSKGITNTLKVVPPTLYRKRLFWLFHRTSSLSIEMLRRERFRPIKKGLNLFCDVSLPG